jgi:hypothetical protein
MPAPTAAAPDASPPKAPERGVYDLLVEAWGLYRKHARALLLTCAVLFVPAAIVKSCAVAAITAPTLAATTLAREAAEVQANDLEASRRALQEAYQRTPTPPPSIASRPSKRACCRRWAAAAWPPRAPSWAASRRPSSACWACS